MNTPSQPHSNTAAGAIDRAGLNATVIAELARAAVPKHAVLELPPGCAPRLIWQDKTITNLEGALPRPSAKRGHAQLVDPQSFAAYVRDHMTFGTVLTGDANESGGHFRALLDHHVPTTAANDANKPGWTEHRATMKLQPTPEWARWMAVNDRELEQRAFAEFLEDNAVDIVVPEGEAGTVFPTQQALMSVASTLQIKTDVKFASALRLQNGQVQLGYVENIQGGHGSEGSLPVPERFAIAVAPFRGTPKYIVTCRLRYRGTGGRAAFKVIIERPHKIVESAFNDLKAKIEELVGLRVLVGGIETPIRPNI